jgi:hypothetical protein
MMLKEVLLDEDGTLAKSNITFKVNASVFP